MKTIVNDILGSAAPEVQDHVAGGNPQAVAEPASCCSPVKQASCCEPSEKAACCGQAAAGGSCGCQ